MTCVACAESRLHKMGTFQFLASFLYKPNDLHRAQFKIINKNTCFVTQSCKTSLNHCKCSITIPISHARLHNTALQGKQAWLAGKDCGHGREGQQGVAGSGTASFIPATDSSHAQREEGGKAKITCRALVWRGSAPIHHLSEPCSTASQNCKSSQLPPAFL